MKLSPILIFFLFVQLLSSQIQDKVDFIRSKVNLEPDGIEKMIKGTVGYDFEVLHPVDSIFLDAHNMQFSQVLLNGKPISYINSGKKIIIQHKFKKAGSHILELKYTIHPKQTVYFLGWDDSVEGNEQIWTQGQGKYTSHWLPSLDDMNEKVEFDLSIVFKNGYQVVSNGKLVGKESLGRETKWNYEMKEPMSSYLVAFAIGDFDKKTISSSSGIPIELYYEPKDSLKEEPTYRFTKQIFDFLENEIGVAYPWQNYKQVPVQDFLYAGMENTTCTIFSNQYVIDSTAFVDKNYVNVNAHELAHHWFGDLVTEVSSEHHWLQEGFATYYAYLAEKEIFGDSYFYWHLLETAEALENFSDDDQGEALQNPGAGSLTFYEKGAWALVILREMVGEKHFKLAMQNYLKKYAFQNVAIPDFMREMEKVSGKDLSNFETTWLNDADFPFETVQTYLEQHEGSIKTYFELKSKIGDRKENVEAVLRPIWHTLSTTQLKSRLVFDYGKLFSNSFLNEILSSGDLKVRQAVILSLETIPAEVLTEAENILEDKSYTSNEAALYKLWSGFPDNRTTYLDKTDNLLGFPNKNLRLLWLTLALVTPEYRPDMKPQYYRELNAFTGSAYHFETRLLAFEYLKSIGGFNDEALKNLIDACSHHVWHFKKSARSILNDYLNREDGIARIKSLYPSLNEGEKLFLDEKLGE